MSRLIKSAYARAEAHGGKIIRLREVSVPAIQSEFSETPETGTITSSGSSIHYSERENALSAEYEELEKLKRSLESEKAEWESFKNNQLDQIRQGAEQEFNQAAEAGYNEGYEHGAAQAQADYKNLIEEARKTVELSGTDYGRKLHEAEPEMLHIAMQVARKIIGTELNTDEAAWVSLVRQAVAEVREQEEIKIYVHPDKYDMTLYHQKEFQTIALHSRELLIFPDHSLAPDACLIDTPYGQLDASVDSQLREVKRLLADKLKEGTADGN